VSHGPANRALSDRLVSFAWQEWAQMGLLIAPSYTSPWAQDPEALIVFTLEVGRDEPRLFDELLDWILHNEARLSVRRLRAMCLDETDRRLVEATVGWLASHRPRARWSPRREGDQAALGRTDLEPLFRAEDMPIRKVDPDFAAVGFLRPLLLPSGKSVSPDLMTTIDLAFRLRAILGVGIRSEVVRIMLTGRPALATAQMLAHASGYSKRNVHDALSGLAEAQVLASFNMDAEQRYRINTEIWAALLQRDVTSLPIQRDWPQLLGSLRLIQRWSNAQKNLDSSDYMRRSETRQLLLRISPDLGFAGIEINPKVTAEQAPRELERVLDSVLARLTPQTHDHESGRLPAAAISKWGR
jgi:hypothetical protein